MILYPCKSLRVLGFVWPTRSMILAMGEVLCFGFIPCGDLSSDRRGSEARIVLFPSRVKDGVFIIGLRLSLYIMSSCLRRYSVHHELNTLDACWIAVDVWSNSSRCRKYRSTCLGRDAYMYDHCLRYCHDFARFYQLLDSNLFTHSDICYF